MRYEKIKKRCTGSFLLFILSSQRRPDESNIKALVRTLYQNSESPTRCSNPSSIHYYSDTQLEIEVATYNDSF
jgi:hypothetical protein